MRNVPLSGTETRKLLIRIVLIFEKRNSKKMSIHDTTNALYPIEYLFRSQTRRTCCLQMTSSRVPLAESEPRNLPSCSPCSPWHAKPSRSICETLKAEKFPCFRRGAFRLLFTKPVKTITTPNHPTSWSMIPRKWNHSRRPGILEGTQTL